MNPPLHIGIAGCGIAGLSAGILLARQGHRVSLFDQFPHPAPVGAGLVLQPVGQAVLARLSLLQAALDTGARIQVLSGREVIHGRQVLNVRYSPDDDSRFGLGIHRAALFGLLYASAIEAGVDIASGCQVIASRVLGNKRLLHIAGHDDEIDFDLVIDATGAGSTLSPLRRSPLRYGAVWTTVDWPADSAIPGNQLSQRYRHASVMLGVLPVGLKPESTGPQATIFWSLPVNEYQAWRESSLQAWMAELNGIWPEIGPFLQDIRHHDDFTLATYSHGTLRRPYGNRIVYIGDSAHCTSPQLGQGANMALLDAMALADSLRAYPLADAPAAYARKRRNHVWVYQLISRLLTPLYQSDSIAAARLRDRILAPLSGVPPLPVLLGKLVSGDFIKPIR